MTFNPMYPFSEIVRNNNLLLNFSTKMSNHLVLKRILITPIRNRNLCQELILDTPRSINFENVVLDFCIT